MTISPAGTLLLMFRQCGRIILVLMTIVAGWFGAMALVMATTEIAPASIAVVSNQSVLAKLPKEFRLIKSTGRVLVLTSSNPGYVRRLYRSGAWLVLPSLRNGCLDLTRGTKNWSSKSS